MCSALLAQDGTEFTLEKAATAIYIISPRWSAQLGSEYRNTPTESLENEPLQFNSKHLQFSLNSAYEVGFYAKLGGGLMYRFNTLENPQNENEIRLTQQYTYAKPFNALRLSHRIKLDQRLRPTRTTHRIRYRFLADFPLNGLSIDLGEYYAVVSSESLLNTGSKEKPAWDQRFTLGVGNQLFKKIKVQLDLQYRLENYFVSTKERVFIVTQLFYKI